jgi:hypothetical protein
MAAGADRKLTITVSRIASTNYAKQTILLANINIGEAKE